MAKKKSRRTRPAANTFTDLIASGRQIQILNAEVSVDGENFIQLIGAITLGSFAGRAFVSFVLPQQQAEVFQTAWELSVLEGDSAEEAVAEFNPAGTPAVRYRSNIRYSAEVAYCDVAYRNSVVYSQVRAGGAVRLDVDYTDVAYYSSTYQDVVYSAVAGSSLTEPQPDQPVNFGTLTIRGVTGAGRIVVQVDGVDHAELADSQAGPGLKDVLIRLTTTLPLAQLISMIEAE